MELGNVIKFKPGVTRGPLWCHLYCIFTIAVAVDVWGKKFVYSQTPSVGEYFLVQERTHSHGGPKSEKEFKMARDA